MKLYRPDIDGLRAIAVIPVVLYHAGLPGFGGGYVGVDVFFVISGFLITGILHDDLSRGRFSLVDFYERRARRLLPALSVVVLICFIAVWFVEGPRQFEQFAKSAVATATFSSNLWFWKTSDYFGAAVEFKPLLHTWSLAVEEQFYIVFPLLLWLLHSRRRSVLLGAMALLCAGSFTLAAIDVVRAPTAAFYLAPLRAWELGIGVLLALGAVPGSGRPWIREAAAALGAAAILVPVTLYNGETPFPGFAALPPCLGAAALIWAGAQGPNRTSALLSLSPMVFVGAISYSLYLWHWPILAVLRLRLDRIDLPPAVAAGAVAAAFLAAVVSWTYVERPFRGRRVGSRGQILSAAAVALALMMLAGVGVWRSGGLPGRFSPDVLQAYAAANNIDPAYEACFGRRPAAGLCPVAQVGERADFLVWGDSHALSNTPGIGAAAVETGYGGLLATMPTCPPLLDLEIPRLRGDCAGFNAAVLAFLRERDDMPVVILSARLAALCRGRSGAGRTGPADPARAARRGGIGGLRARRQFRPVPNGARRDRGGDQRHRARGGPARQRPRDRLGRAAEPGHAQALEKALAAGSGTRSGRPPPGPRRKRTGAARRGGGRHLRLCRAPDVHAGVPRVRRWSVALPR